MGTGPVATEVRPELRASERLKEELQSPLFHARRLDELGTLAGGIAHDLNNMLMPIVALSKRMLSRVPADSSDYECLELIHQSGERARDLVRQLLTFAHRAEPDRRQVDLTALVANRLPLLRSTLPARVAIIEKLGVVPPIWADEVQLDRVLLNLVNNAVQAIGDGPGDITIEIALEPAATATLAGEAQIRLSVTDTGCGMDDATRQRVFEPFFTTRRVNAGTGLGLSVVHEIIASHGATITVDSQPLRGARFDIRFRTTTEGGTK